MRNAIRTLLILLALPVGVLQAQRLAPSPFPHLDRGEALTAPIRAVVVGKQTSPALMAAAGVAGGALGAFGGALVGARITQGNCEDCGLVGLAYGGVAGESALVPLGVHLANGGRGDLGKSLLASLAIGAAGFGVALGSNTAGVLLAVPVLQIASSILIERATSRPAPAN